MTRSFRIESLCFKSLRALSGLSIIVAALTGPVSAQDYPTRPITIIVPIAPGGVGDVITRLFANKVTENNAATIVVENKAGGGGIPGTLAAAKASHDGYTLLTGFHGPLSILPHMQKVGYDPAKEFVPVAKLISVPNVLVVHPSIPASSVSELIAYAKANPGKLTFASQGVGTTGHLGGELFKRAAGIEITHVPYRGAAPAAQDLAAGHVSMMFDVVSLAAEAIKDGRLKVIGVATKERVPIMPDVPTLMEQGLPVELTAWFGLVAPTGTPEAIIAWLNKQANDALSSADVRDRFAAQGAVFQAGSASDFGQFIEAETKKFGEIVERANIQVQ